MTIDIIDFYIKYELLENPKLANKEAGVYLCVSHGYKTSLDWRKP